MNELKTIFKKINAKYGYTSLKEIGFFCYKSDGWGDWHKNTKLKNIIIIGYCKGYNLKFFGYNILENVNIETLKGFLFLNYNLDEEEVFKKYKLMKELEYKNLSKEGV